MELNLERIKALAQKATPGPWEVESELWIETPIDDLGYRKDVAKTGNRSALLPFADAEEKQRWLHDAEYIAAVNPSWAQAAVAEIEMLREDVERCERILERQQDDIDDLHSTEENRSRP